MTALSKRFSGALLLSVAYFLVAAAAFNGFYDKWHFREGAPRFAFASVIDGTADRPFVYRQLLPTAASWLEDALPPAAKQRALSALLDRRGMLRSRKGELPRVEPGYVLRHQLVYYACFGLLWLSLFVMRRLCIEIGIDPVAASLAPGLFALTLPFWMTAGGYFYDFPELFFLASALLLAQRGRWLLLVPVTLLGTLNKESFLFFVVTLFPILRARYSARKTSALVAGLTGISGVTYLGLRAAYAGNPGGSLENHLLRNLTFYLHPANLLRFDSNYGVLTPSGYGLASIVVIALVFRGGWRGLVVPVRQHLWLAAAISVPLLVAFCWPGEMRNLSLCYVGTVAVLARALSGWTAGPDARLNRSPAP